MADRNNLGSRAKQPLARRVVGVRACQSSALHFPEGFAPRRNVFARFAVHEKEEIVIGHLPDLLRHHGPPPVVA